MLPLAMLLNDVGATVAGSDRALDQGRIGAKFDYLAAQGIGLFPQDGSGLVDGAQILVASAAIEDSVPDVARANALGCKRMTRAELLAELFNAAPARIAVGGTSGKSTVTGMIGWIMAQCGRDPTIMNGAVMKNFARDDAPFISSRSGNGELFVSEVDESDGSIALFRPTISVLNNVSLDHKSLEELHALFGDFVAKGDVAVWNADDAESRAVMAGASAKRAVSFGFTEGADYRAVDVAEAPFSATFTLQVGGADYAVSMAVPGRHNIANGLAALAAAEAAGVPLSDAIAALSTFTGTKRRFELVGQVGDQSNGGADAITVIDDFGHNPEKIAATLNTLKAFDGRVLAFFQPHGFGPLRVMGAELAAMFADSLGAEDRVVFCDPVYFGGTVDRSVGSPEIVARINAAAGHDLALHIPERAECGAWLVANAQAGDRIVIMGARDDSLSLFAAEVLAGIEAR